MKDAAQDAAQDVTQGVVEDAPGAAEDGGVKVLVHLHFPAVEPTHKYISPRQAPFERSKQILGAAGPGTILETSSARFGIGGARSGARRHGELFLRMRRRGQEARGRVAITSAQSAWVRARSAARSAARRRVKFSSARAGGQGRGSARSAAQRGVRRVSAWAKTRWPAGLQPGVVAMCSSARAGVGEGAVACSSIDFGRPGALLTTGLPSGIWLGLKASASGGAAQSASVFIRAQWVSSSRLMDQPRPDECVG